MELKHLRAFAALADELHFGRAGTRLGIAQPHLSLVIQALEASIGVALFERSRRHVALTDAGRLFLPEARATLSHAERAQRTAQRAARGEIGRLEIGFTGSSPFNRAMPRIISHFRRCWPEVQMGLREMSTSDQFQALRDGTLDIGVVRPAHPAETDGIVLTTVLEEPLFAVVPNDHPLSGRASISVAALAGDPFIIHPRRIGTGLHDKIIALCTGAGFTPRLALEAHQMSTIVGLTAAGLGVSIVPEAMRRIHVEGARFLSIEDAGASMILAVACRSDDLRPITRHFLASVAVVTAVGSTGVSPA